MKTVEQTDVVINKHGNKLNFICDVCNCEFSVSAKFCERKKTDKDDNDLNFVYKCPECGSECQYYA